MTIQADPKLWHCGLRAFRPGDLVRCLLSGWCNARQILDCSARGTDFIAESTTLALPLSVLVVASTAVPCSLWPCRNAKHAQPQCAAQVGLRFLSAKQALNPRRHRVNLACVGRCRFLGWVTISHKSDDTVDGQNPALPIIRNIP